MAITLDAVDVPHHHRDERVIKGHQVETLMTVLNQWMTSILMEMIVGRGTEVVIEAAGNPPHHPPGVVIEDRLVEIPKKVSSTRQRRK